MAAFSLLIELLKSNVRELCWQDIDLANQHAFVRAVHSKSKKPIPAPLNSKAISILKEANR